MLIKELVDGGLSKDTDLEFKKRVEAATIEELLQRDAQGNTLLHVAISESLFCTMKVALEKFIAAKKLGERNKDKEIPLHLAILNPISNLVPDKDRNDRIFLRLIEASTNEECLMHDKRDQTPVHYSIFYYREKAALKFVERLSYEDLCVTQYKTCLEGGGKESIYEFAKRMNKQVIVEAIRAKEAAAIQNFIYEDEWDKLIYVARNAAFDIRDNKDEASIVRRAELHHLIGVAHFSKAGKAQEENNKELEYPNYSDALLYALTAISIGKGDQTEVKHLATTACDALCAQLERGELFSKGEFARFLECPGAKPIVERLHTVQDGAFAKRFAEAEEKKRAAEKSVDVSK